MQLWSLYISNRVLYSDYVKNLAITGESGNFRLAEYLASKPDDPPGLLLLSDDQLTDSTVMFVVKLLKSRGLKARNVATLGKKRNG